MLRDAFVSGTSVHTFMTTLSTRATAGFSSAGAEGPSPSRPSGPPALR